MCFITEANLWDGLLPSEMEIQGHTIVIPNTMESMGNARIVLLVKNELTCQKLNQYMDNETATICVRVGETKRKSIVIGGIYREHQQLGQVDRNVTRLEKQITPGEQQWRKILKNSGKC